MQCVMSFEFCIILKEKIELIGLLVILVSSYCYC